MSDDEREQARELAEERVNILIDKGYIEEEMFEEKVEQLIEKLLRRDNNVERDERNIYS